MKKLLKSLTFLGIFFTTVLSAYAEMDCRVEASTRYTWNGLVDITCTITGVSVKDDPDAEVTGNATDGYVIRPSAGLKDVTVVIGEDVDPSKVTLVLDASVESVVAKGAQIKIMRGEHDIANFLALPPADSAGRIDLTQATVKPEIVNEPLDPEKGGSFQVVDGEPVVTTAPTRPGLAYTLREGYKSDKMVYGDSTIGDGSSWTPSLRVKGGNIGFYSITVSREMKPAEAVIPPTAKYCVIDLSGGTEAESYPVSYLDDVPFGGWTDEYKTTKLVLRRIKAGTFTMGSSEDEDRRYSHEVQHQVTLTQDYWIGIFEVTQKQWELVKGSNPSQYKGSTRPVENVLYNTIRGSSSGAGWPGSSDVDSYSFIGKLRSKVPLLQFDLPTEAQWEYACRAGTTTALNSGKSATTENMKEVGRFASNQTDGKGGYSLKHTTVGSYLPNAWGLYDMHGNVCEWCLDRYQSDLYDGEDPKGPASGSTRVLRGGCWYGIADRCTSSIRFSLTPDRNYYVNFDTGFRLAACQ